MSKILYDHKWMDLKEDHNGEAFVKMDNAIMLVPITPQKKILLIEEKSIAYQSPTLTLPTGGVEKHEKPEITANRELQEEVGVRAKTLTYLATLHPAIKYMEWKCHIYLAQDLIRSRLIGDESSAIKVHSVHISQIDKLIKARKLTDATSIAAIYLARSYLKK